MAVTTSVRTVTYTGTGAVSSYAVPFPFIKNSHLVVKRTLVGEPQTTLTEGVHYTVSGSNIVLTTALANAALLYIERVLPYTQETIFQNLGAFFPAVHQAVFDAAVMMIQQLSDTVVGYSSGLAAEIAGRISADSLLRGEFEQRSAVAADLMNINVREYGALGADAVNEDGFLQAALNAAKAVAVGSNGRVVVDVPNGTYRLGAILKIGSNVHLRLSPRAVFKRMTNANAMIQNDADGVTGGYTATQNIIIEGGVWDANGAAFASNCTAIVGGHATNVTIRNLTVKNVPGWHHVEVNAVKDCWIQNCVFEDYIVGAVNKEAVQLDLMASSGAFPWFGPYDFVPCINVTVDGCLFRGTMYRGVGSHTAVNNILHEQIKLTNNTFQNCMEDAIYIGGNWKDVTITGNTFKTCWRGIYGVNNEGGGTGTTQSNFAITGNVFRDFTTHNATLARAIYFQGQAAQRVFRDITVSGNTVKNIGRHGITFDYCDNVTISANTVKDIGVSTTSGLGIAVFESGKSSVSGNVVEDCWDSCIQVSGASGVGNTVSGNVCRRGGKRGINCDLVSNCVVTGNIVTASYGQGGVDGHGIRLQSSAGVVVTANHVTECQQQGIYVNGSPDCVITDNFVGSNGRQTNNTYAGIYLTTNTDRCTVMNNTVRNAASGNLQSHGVRIFSADCDDNIVVHNDLLTSGSTASFADAGTGTLTTLAGGNRTYVWGRRARE